jgi:hypothetical protein
MSNYHLLAMEQDLVTVSEELLEAGKSVKGGWSKAQLAILGEVWPPRSGWKKEIIGRRISKMDADKFVQLRQGEGPEQAEQVRLF